MHRFAPRQWFFSDSARNVFSFCFVKVEQTIDAAICAFTFAFFQWSRADERQRPMLELEFVELSESLRAFKICWLLLSLRTRSLRRTHLSAGA